MSKLERLISLISHILTQRDIRLFYPLQRSVSGGVDVTFNIPITFKYNIIFGKEIDALFWIPDFQYLHYPIFFTKKEIKSRNKEYMNTIQKAKLIILSSNDVFKDFQQFAPQYSNKVRVMNFVSYVPTEIYNKYPKDIVCKYNLPEKFFYLPNQFWKHKNHKVVFEALNILKDKGINPNIVCTGYKNDNRDPAYFNRLIKEIDGWGINNQIYILGIIPYDDVYMLYRQAICIINPSLFEGWSTSVEEAKSIGKRILLSDINVHHEQNPSKAIYFNPCDPQDLSEKIEKIWVDSKPGPDLELEINAREQLPVRMKRYADNFTKIAFEARRL